MSQDKTVIQQIKDLCSKSNGRNNALKYEYADKVTAVTNKWVSRWLCYKLSGYASTIKQRHWTGIKRWTEKYQDTWWDLLTDAYLDDFCRVVKDHKVDLIVIDPNFVSFVGDDFERFVANKNDMTVIEVTAALVSLLSSGELLMLELHFIRGLERNKRIKQEPLPF